MYKLILLFIINSLVIGSSQSIQIERQLVSTAGAAEIVDRIIYDMSLGEVIIDQSQPLYTQGFQQSFDFSNLVIKNSDINYNTIITPGDNDKNNYLIFDNIPLHNELLVFDKWNAKVFSKKNYDGSFDGISITGNIIPDGVYIYLLLNEQGDIFYKGTITIKRK